MLRFFAGVGVGVEGDAGAVCPVSLLRRDVAVAGGAVVDDDSTALPYLKVACINEGRGVRVDGGRS